MTADPFSKELWESLLYSLATETPEDPTSLKFVGSGSENLLRD